MNEEAKQLMRSVLTDRPITFRADFARIGGSIAAGLFLSQLCYWSDKGGRTDGFVYKTQAEWEEETALSNEQQLRARKQLKARGLRPQEEVS